MGYTPGIFFYTILTDIKLLNPEDLNIQSGGFTTENIRIAPRAVEDEESGSEGDSEENDFNPLHELEAEESDNNGSVPGTPQEEGNDAVQAGNQEEGDAQGSGESEREDNDAVQAGHQEEDVVPPGNEAEDDVPPGNEGDVPPGNEDEFIVAPGGRKRVVNESPSRVSRSDRQATLAAKKTKTRKASQFH